MTQPTTYKKTNIPWMKGIPEHWEVLRIKNIFTEVDERSETGKEELLSVSHYTGITKKRDALKNEGDLISNAKTLIGYKSVSKGDLVVNIMLAWNGSLGISKYNGITSPAYCVYRIKGNNNPDYYGYLFSTEMMKAEFRKKSYGIIDSRLRLYSDKFFSITSPVPPIEVQNSIVVHLDSQTKKIKAFITKKNTFIKLLKEQRQSVIDNAVTKGLDKTAKLKNTGIDWLGDIPEHWEVRKINFFSELYGRIGFRGYKTSDLRDKGNGAITISPSNMKANKEMSFDNCTYLSWNKYEESPEIKIYKDDILMVKTGATYGKLSLVSYLPEKATINPQIVVFKNINIPFEYLYFSLHSSGAIYQIETNVIGGTIPTISQTKIANLKLPIPPKEEQNQIVSHIKTETVKIDQAIAKTEKEIELIQEYQKAMIAEAVLGKIKL